MRVLLAEDDPAVANFVKKGLAAEHYAVDISHDGEQAKIMASEFNYDLLVLDLTLPRVDGIVILRYLRIRKPGMPILVLTGRNQVEDRVQGLRCLFFVSLCTSGILACTCVAKPQCNDARGEAFRITPISQ
ncbi:MAG: hypothetical protein NVS1B11_28150 [Terriglobales bacterium]